MIKYYYSMIKKIKYKKSHDYSSWDNGGKINQSWYLYCIGCMTGMSCFFAIGCDDVSDCNIEHNTIATEG